MSKEASKAQQMIGDIAPKLAELTDDVLFGDVWERPGLSKRDRSLITGPRPALSDERVAAPPGPRAGQRRHQGRAGRGHHASRLLAGWPAAMSAMTVAKHVFEGRAEKDR